MPIIILVIGLFFQITSVQAFDKEDFADKFYDNVKDQVEKTEKKTVVDRMTHTTGLSEELMENLVANKLNVDNQKELLDWCGKTGTFWYQSRCSEDIKRALFFEMELAETETELQTQLSADETWADGTLQNSPFDLVVDLNILEVVLFGSEADIPLARWEKSEDKDEDDDEEDEDNEDEEDNAEDGEDNAEDEEDNAEDEEDNAEDEEGENDDQNEDNDDNGNDQEDENSSPGDNEDLPDFVPADQPFVGVIEYLEGDEYGQLECRDPNSIIWIDLEEWQKKQGNKDNTNGDEQNKTDDNNQDGDNNGNNNGDNNGNNSGNNSGNSDDSDRGSGFEITPLPEKENCENDLYDGNFCKTTVEEEESCDPLEGVCKKCFGSGGEKSKDKWIDFCITWEFKTREHSLFASRRVEDSINAFIKDSLTVYEDLLGMSPLTPIRRSNREAEQPNWWSIFRNPGKFLYIEGKIPDQWSHESKQISFSNETLTENLKNYQQKTSQLFNCDQNYFDKRTSQFNDYSKVNSNCQNVSLLKQHLNWEKIKRESKNEEIEVYYDNVKQRLDELNDVFYSRFTNQINTKWGSPFTEIIEAREGNCRDWENR